MPNFCENRLAVTGHREQLAQLADHIGINDETPGLVRLYPPPADLADIYGIGAGWALDHWGTKWGDTEWWYSEHSDDQIEVKYLTAWGPFSDRFWQHATKQYPALTFRVSYCEPGMGFAGVDIFRAGTKRYSNMVEDLTRHVSDVDWTSADSIDKLNDQLDRIVERLELDADLFEKQTVVFHDLMGMFSRTN